MKQKLKKQLIDLKNTGFFSIFLSSVFCKVLVFIGGTIIVRILSKTDYGIYAYVLNCISMLCIFNDFGATTAALQFLTEESDNVKKQGAILKYCLKIIFYSAVFSSLLIFLSPLYYPFTINGTKKYVLILGLLPVFTTLSNIFPVILRSNLDNKKYAKFQVFSTFTSYLLLIGLSLLFGLIGAIISQYIYNIILLLFGFYLAYSYIKKYDLKSNLDKREKKDFLKFSIASQVNNSISGLLIIIDTFLIGLLIASSETVATYKVASSIPHAMTFISSCVAIYITPFFVKNKKNLEWIREKYNKLLIYGIVGYGIICFILIAFSKYIITFIYGKQYLDAVPIFIVLMIGLFFTSAFKVPCANIIYSMRKVKINLITNICSAILNFISNIYFINNYGIIGAAITTTLINIIISVVYIIYLNNLLRRKKKDDNV